MCRQIAWAMAVITLLGTVRLPLPFHGDTALFTLGARTLSEGGVYYRDFWDNKQPGIYWFFQLAGGLFGFSEIGIHAFELCYWLGFSGIAMKLMSRVLEPPWLAALFPVFTVAPYLACGSSWHATQLEAIVGFPLFLMAWMSSEVDRSQTPMRAAALAGLCGGIVFVFKLALAPVVIALIFAGTLCARQVGTPWKEIALHRWLPILAGLTVAPLVAVAYFVPNGLFNELRYVTLEYPREAIRTVPLAPASRLVDSGMWFLRGFGGCLLVALPYAFAKWQRRRPSAFFLHMVAWIAGAAISIGLQRFSWWQYHFLLFAIPAGALAIAGLEAAHAAVPARLAAATALVAGALVLGPTAVATAYRVRTMAKAWPSGSDESQTNWVERYQGTGYAHALAAALPLSTMGRPGAIYVFGDPLIYHVSKREQALAIHGWAWEFFTSREWAKLPKLLERAAPVCVFLEDGYADLVGAQSPETLSTLQRRYAKLPRDPGIPGTWWAAR